MQGLRIGHETDPTGRTGVTVLVMEDGAVAGYDLRGSAPATRETDLLGPTCLVSSVNAIVLAGGSAFGLAAADGVVSFLDECGVGFPTPAGPVPIVPAAAIYDLEVAGPGNRPDASMGRRAARKAREDDRTCGSVGAGAGASVGKILGQAHASRGGLGTVEEEVLPGVTMLALVVVNALGDVIDEDGSLLAGPRDPVSGRLTPTMDLLDRNPGAAPVLGNTTLGVLATDLALDRISLVKLAQMAHDGLARALEPAHTMYDGDLVFAVSTGRVRTRADLSRVGALGARLMARAIRVGVRAATSRPDLP